MPLDEQDLGLKDRNIVLAEERTELAIYRSFLAAERTLMAWMRTALSMISFGLTMVKFFEYLGSSPGDSTASAAGRLIGREGTPRAVGFSMMIIGTGSLIMAIVVHRKELKNLSKEGLAPRFSLALLVSCLLAALGVFAVAGILVGG